MFNRFRGCRLAECKCEHVSNRIINGRVCLSPHPGYQHYVASKSGGDISLWKSELSGEIDEKFLIDGLTEGFPLNLPWVRTSELTRAKTERKGGCGVLRTKSSSVDPSRDHAISRPATSVLSPGTFSLEKLSISTLAVYFTVVVHCMR